MFALQSLAPDLHVVALPAPPDVPLPWGAPRNVYVFTGDAPALLDTGHAATIPSLLEALRALDLLPEDIVRVGLTSLAPDAVGGLAAFEDATAWTAAALRHDCWATERARYDAVFDALLAHPHKPETWTRDRADRFLASYFTGATLDLRPVQDGQPLRLGNYVLDALQLEGVGMPAAGYFAADRGWLFAGPTATLTPRPLLDDPGELLASTGKLGAMSVKRVFPVRGLIEEHPPIFFRALSLFTTNMRSNMQHVLSRPLSSIALTEADLGYLPSDMVRFAASVLEYDAIFREFAAAGVIREAGEGLHPAFPLYQMGTPVARRGPVPAP